MKQFLCYHKRNTGYKAEVSKYSGATCGWIPGRSNYDLHYIRNYVVKIKYKNVIKE
jgi:putative component of membrane protein insertase Oxa1/YidC/SpoIIIJ protein YidD